MHRVLGLSSVVVVALFTVFGVSQLTTRSLAQDSTSATAGHPLVGTWRTTATEEGFPPLDLVDVFNADGTLVGIHPAAYEVEPGVVMITSPGAGVWKATGPHTAAYTVDVMLAYVDGTFAGRQTIRGTRVVSADGQISTGEYTYSIADPSGNIVFASGGTEVITRLTVEPMETLPAASPAATR